MYRWNEQGDLVKQEKEERRVDGEDGEDGKKETGHAGRVIYIRGMSRTWANRHETPP